MSVRNGSMELSEEHKMKTSDGLDGGADVSRMGEDSIFKSTRIFGSTRISNMDQTGDDSIEDNSEVRIRVERRRSLDMVKIESWHEKELRKVRSKSTQLLINIDEIVHKVAGKADERSSSLSDSHFGSNCFPSDENLDFPMLQIPNSSDQMEVVHSSPGYEENSDSIRRRKMQLEPTLPMSVKFEDVKYKVPLKGVKRSKSEKCILHGITGSVHPGEVLALMGPSGGGKTTLINLLSGRLKFNSGTITYNGQPYNKSLKRRIGFVMQDDVVMPHLTVKETLTYSALLRLPSTLSIQQKKERADNVITELGLERCQNTIIGGAFVRGISGGERKRVCIGNEILLNPSLLFLDEPTSGLDSTTALRIIHMLKNIAKSGKTIMTTIHQPSSRLFSNFDKLILLGKGSSLYFGKASEAMLYFSSIGCSPLIAMNPAEFLIDLANGNMNDKSVPSELEDKFSLEVEKIDLRDHESTSVDVHEYLVEAYAARERKREKSKLMKPDLVDRKPNGISFTVGTSREWEATWWEQFSILFRRGFRERRHEYFSCLRVTQVISTAIIIGLLWWNSDASTTNRLQDQAGLLFFISVFWAFFPLFTAVFTFPQERAILAKERSVDMYKLTAYFVARIISDIPLDLILPLLFIVIVYFMVGLKLSFEAFSLTMLTVFLSVVAAQGLGLTIGAAFMDVKKAATFASITIMTFMLSGGFFIQKAPPFMSWIRYLSFNYHTYRLLLRIQYCSSSSSLEMGACDSPFIKRLNLDQGGKEVGAMILMIIGYRVLAYLFLRRIKPRKTG